MKCSAHVETIEGESNEVVLGLEKGLINGFLVMLCSYQFSLVSYMFVVEQGFSIHIHINQHIYRICKIGLVFHSEHEKLSIQNMSTLEQGLHDVAFDHLKSMVEGLQHMGKPPPSKDKGWYLEQN